MQFYILAGLMIFAILFLVMIATQLFKIEKSISEVAELTEHRIKKLYLRG
jgi:hypothetical protein